MLFAIGAGDRVVGVSSFDTFPPEVLALPKVGALVTPDSERVLALRPDLVLIYGTQTEEIARFEAAGIRL
jgi:ABC-type hemin transport system substrate-binding protein